MNTLLLALTVVVSAQDTGLNTKVDSFMRTAESLDSVVKQLARLSKETLIVSGGLSTEPIFINLHDTTVQGVMDRIADATYGSWKLENGAYTLIQGADAQTASSRARQQRVDAMRVVLQTRLADLRRSPWGPNSADEVVQSLDKLRDKYRNSFRVPDGVRPRVNIGGIPTVGPIDQVAAACLEQISPEQVVDLESGHRIVLSSRPNRLQQPMRGDLSQVMAQFSRATAEIYDASKRTMVRDFNADWEGSLGLPTKRDILVAKLNAVLARDGDAVGLEVQIIGVNGEDLGSKTIALSTGDQGSEEGFDPSTHPQDSGDSIKLTSVSREFLNLSGNFGERSSMSMAMRTEGGLVRVDAGQAPSTIQPSAALAAFFNSPATSDFQGLLLPECFEKVTDGKDFVAIVPDDMWSKLIDRAGGESIPVDEFLKLMKAHTEVMDVGGVTVWRCSDPIRSQRWRSSRIAMQKLTNQVHKAGFGHLKDIAAYVSGRGRSVNEGDADARLLAVSLPFVSPVMVGYPTLNYPLAQFLDHAPDLVKDVPAGKNEWAYGSLNAAMKSAFEQMVLSKRLGNLGDGMSISVMMGNDEPKVPMASDREPTERFPNGLPGDMLVTIDIIEQIGVLGKLRGHPTGQLMSAVQLGAITGFIEGSGGANSELKISEFEEFFEAVTRSIEVTYAGSIGDGVFTDGYLKPYTQAKAYNALDPEILKLGEQAREAVRESAQRMRNEQRADPPR